MMYSHFLSLAKKKPKSKHNHIIIHAQRALEFVSFFE